MGGGSSRPAKRDIIPPKPAGPDMNTGVSISQSQGCTSGDCSKCKPGQDRNTCCSPCELIVPANVSSSAVSMGRILTPGSAFSASTKLFIKPTIPFEVTFNGTSEQINLLTMYHPSPIRIENVQHDAVLALGDPLGGNRLIVLIPMVASPKTTEAGNFVGKIATYMTALTGPLPEGKTQYDPVSAPTGADWNLTKLIPVGQNSIASPAFFTWNSSEYTQTLISDTPFVRRFGWTATPGPQYILMADPISINPVDLESIRRLPLTEPQSAIHPIGIVSYKNAPPKDCKDCGKPSIADLQQYVFAKKGSPGLSPEAVTTLLISVASLIVGLYAISVGLKWALSSGLLKKWSDAIANILPKRPPPVPKVQ
jgi:hypothetical protein